MYIDCLLSYLVTVPYAVLCFFPMKDQLKYSRRKTLLIAGTVGFVTLAVSSLLIWRYQLYANDLLVPILSIFFVSYQFCLKAKPWKSLAVFSAAVALMSIIGNMAACFDSYLQFTAGTESGSRASMIFQLIVSTAVTLLLAKPYRERGSMIVNRTEQPRVWYMTLLFSAAVFAVNMLLLPIERERAYEEKRILYLELILIALLFLWLLMQIIFYFIVSGLLSMADTEKRNRFLEMQQMQFASQQRYMKDSEKVRHDFRHSIRTLTELYDSGNMDAVGKYLHEYIEAMPVSEITPYCENTAVNALLNLLRARCPAERDRLHAEDPSARRSRGIRRGSVQHDREYSRKRGHCLPEGGRADDPAFRDRGG